MLHHHQTAAFLLKASNFLPTNAQYTTVRTHLMSKYKELVKRPLGDVNRCSTCGTDFKTALPSHHIEPVLAPNRFQRRHLRDEQYKTKYQALRMKQFHTKIHNQQKLVTVCPMCKKSHVTKLTKPSNILTTKVIKQVSIKQKKNAKKKLKRLQKKKNRAFAGLNENVVLSVVNNLKNNSAPSAVMCLSDTAAPSAGDNVGNNVDRSPIIISDSPCTKLQCDSIIELSENETDKSVILLSSPTSTNSNLQDSDVFIIDTTPSTSSTKPKKLNNNNSIKALSSKISPIKPTVARSSNTNIKQVQKSSPKLTKKQKKLLKQHNTSVNSTFVTEIASTSKQNVVKKKANKNTILVQPLKKDKKSQKLNSLSNLLNNNNTRTKSSSMLTEFLKTIT